MAREPYFCRSRNPFARARQPTPVVPNVTLLGSHRVNFYAIREGRGFTLVDCGFYGHIRYLEAFLSQQGVRLSQVEAVVITHGHADHLGFAAKLAEMNVPVFIPEADMAFAQHPRSRLPPPTLVRKLWRPSCMGLLFEAAADGVFSQPLVERATPYHADSVLDVPGRLQAIHVPGHTDGNCSLYMPDGDAMFTGDTLMTRHPILNQDGLTAFSEHPARDREAIANLNRLEPYANAALLPAHGEPWTTPGALAKAISSLRSLSEP